MRGLRARKLWLSPCPCVPDIMLAHNFWSYISHFPSIADFSSFFHGKLSFHENKKNCDKSWTSMIFPSSQPWLGNLRCTPQSWGEGQTVPGSQPPSARTEASPHHGQPSGANRTSRPAFWSDLRVGGVAEFIYGHSSTTYLAVRVCLYPVWNHNCTERQDQIIATVQCDILSTKPAMSIHVSAF